MKLPTLVTAIALSVALTGTLSAAPQADKAPKAKADATAQKSDKAGKAAPKGALTAADLPKAVTDAVMKAHPGATVASATKSGMGADTVYAVRVNTGATGKAGMVTMHLKEDGTMAAAKGGGKAGAAKGAPKGTGK